MKKSDLAARFKTLGSFEKMEDVRAEIVNLQKELEKDYTDYESVITERDNLKKDNESLNQANMKLFLQIGGEGKNKDEDNPPDEKELKYEDLFNEEGGLK